MGIIQKELPGKFGGIAELENEPPVEWLIRNWLAARELSVLYGQGGTMKSYIALGWTLQLAARAIPTMYIAAEGTSGLRSRVDAWRAARGNPEESLPKWGYYNANVQIDQSNALNPWIDGLLEYCAKPTPELLVIDTLARNFSGDENLAKDMNAFVEGCEYLRRTLNTAVLVIHHMGVDTGRERGTAALRNATFGMFQTSRPKTSRTGASIDLECDRMKDAEMPDPVRCYFDKVDLDISEHGEVFRHSLAMRKFPPRKKQRPRGSTIKQEENGDG